VTTFPSHWPNGRSELRLEAKEVGREVEDVGGLELEEEEEEERRGSRDAMCMQNAFLGETGEGGVEHSGLQFEF
jgi:hypothetical protein